MNRDTIQKILIGLFVTACIFLGIQVMDVDSVLQVDKNSTKTEMTVASSGSRMTYGRFLEYLEMGWVKQVDLYDNSRNAIVVAVSPESDDRSQTIRVEIPVGASQLIQKLKEYDVDFDAHPAENKNLWITVASNVLLPILFVGGLFYFFQNSENFPGGSGSSPMNIGKSTARFEKRPDTGVVFDDIAGIDEAKAEFEEIVSFLKQPDKYTIVGAKIPKGILLVGPPGTGKTLLAKAVAGEAGVPFFSISAAEFIEMFVGVGASRVRDLFEQAKKNAPCIVFIDELDAVGTKRGGENESREVHRTMLELLNQLDGFSQNDDIKVIAATNRPDVLDPALLRSGRLDRKIELPLPNEESRARILQIHSRKMTVDKNDVNFEELARATPEFNGAQMKAVCVEAGMEALRRSGTVLRHEDFISGINEVMAKKKASLNYYA